MTTKRIKMNSAQKKALAQLSDLRALRLTLRMNQSGFWTKYGVTQSGGSRYESGRDVPTATRMLMTLHVMGVVSNDDLARAGAVAAELGKTEDAAE